ncbi:MAG: hypothetical protein F4W95_08160 [Chloroflexi bacterium]|nr:hypothetical protein [Chloroflexota bacterium]MYD48446.1 hypothetical protein [Chloroflexota bacterium]
MRIGINIPNELMKRLEPLKPELNISQVCREALAAKAEQYERAITDLNDDDTKSALERTSSEEIRRLSLLNVNWAELGYQDAVAWVKAATWKDWNHWRSIQDLLQRQNRPAWDIQPRLFDGTVEDVKYHGDRLHDFHDLIFEQSDEFFEWMDDNGLEIDWRDVAREHKQAWFAYVEAAWRLIQQQRDDHFEEIRKERLTRHMARSQPEIPEHILSDISRTS